MFVQFLPDDWFNGAFAPWFMQPFLIAMLPSWPISAFLTMMVGLEVNDIDLMFHPENYSTAYFITFNAITLFSEFVVAFFWGALIGLVIGKMKQRRMKQTQPPAVTAP